MTGDSTITITVLIAVVTVACTLYNTFRGRSKDNEHDVDHRIQEAATRAEEMTKINIKLDSISADIRYMREETTGMKSDIQKLNTEVELLKASIRSAHKRMDGAGIGKLDIEVERKD